jgi:hypothetical protein
MQKAVPKPSHGSLICAFSDCPNRVEEMNDLRVIFSEPVTCPELCDWSTCTFNGKIESCEILVSEGRCYRGFRR